MIYATIFGFDFVFETSDKVFSPHHIDSGTLAMLSKVSFTPEDKVLDLGCGYGVVGIAAAKLIGAEQVILCDNNDAAITMASHNAAANGVPSLKIVKSDGLESVEDTDFTMILSNPPYHADFSVAKKFIEKSFNRLRIGGKLYMVTKRKEWYKNKLISVFGGVIISEIDSYYVFISEKRAKSYADKPRP